MMYSSVIIDNLDVRRARRPIWPFKTDAPLIVDPDAVLPLPIALQRFEPVAGQRRQIMKNVRRFKTIELEPGGPLGSRERFHPFAGGEVSRSLVAVADDHRSRL